MPGCRAGSPARRRPICDALGREVDPRDLPPARCRLSLPSWPTRGDRVLKSIRIGHTEQGPYIIPELVRLDDSPHASDHLFTEAEYQSVAQVEPFERRVTRTVRDLAIGC
jgi:hypothetical protein